MSDAKHPFNVLFLCTGNSARSIIAEALLREVGKGRFNAYSAGSHPSGKVNARAIALLDANSLPTPGMRSKSWNEFARPDAPPLDFVVTVCDNAAGEVCPLWPGRPATAHWGIADPAAVDGTDEEQRNAFAEAYRLLLARIRLFTSLPFDKLDRLSLQHRLREIGDA